MPPRNRTATTYLIYIDDSGNSDIDVLAALLVPVDAWGSVIGYWKAHRRSVHRLWKIPPTVEFHSVEIARRAGSQLLDHGNLDVRGDPQSIYYPRSIELADGSTMSRLGLFGSAVNRLGDFNTGQRDFGVRLLVCGAHQANGSAGLYEVLLNKLEEYLDEDQSWGVVWHDGTDAGKARVLRGIHRNLGAHDRRILEDPIPMDSSQSHFVQMADVCAYTAFKFLEAGTGAETRTNVGEMFTRLDGLNVLVAAGGQRGVRVHLVESENEKGLLL